MRHSIGEYPPDWYLIAQDVKNAAGWKCERCGHVHEPETGYTLTVHHLDMNPANCRWWNLAALCQRCHLYIQAKVVLPRVWMFEHSEWFKPHVAGYYAHLYGLPEDRELVEEMIDKLIDLGTGKTKLADYL